MKKILMYMAAAALAAAIVTACENDDTDFSRYTNAANADDGDDDSNTALTSGDTIFIVWSGSSATVSGDSKGYVSTTNADVVVDDPTATADASDLVLVLSGSTSDGSLLVYRQKKYTIVLSGVSITNQDGPAINNQCGKALSIVCADGTTNTLADGTAYDATVTIDQKGALFSEGQILFSGAGELSVLGNSKNAIASDDYITIDGDVVINATTSASGSNGIKVNDGMFINGGTLTVSVASDGGRGIRSEARTVITGGTTTITTTGDCLIETAGGTADTTSCACIKSDSLFTMTGGSLYVTSTGDGGKGIRCSQNIEFGGGTLVATTTGSNDLSKPKAVKSDTGIIVSGGSFKATVSKSWACDNGYESADESVQAANCVTVVGTPTTKTLAKKTVTIIY